jgi:hypothetical protein
MTNKRKSRDELRYLSRAIDDSILCATDAEIAEELTLLGIDPDKAASEIDAFVEEAKRMAGKVRLDRAREAATSFRGAATNLRPADTTVLRSSFDRMRSGSGAAGGMMLAARKGKQVSDDDDDGLLDDLAQLEALEAEVSDK